MAHAFTTLTRRRTLSANASPATVALYAKYPYAKTTATMEANARTVWACLTRRRMRIRMRKRAYNAIALIISGLAVYAANSTSVSRRLRRTNVDVIARSIRRATVCVASSVMRIIAISSRVFAWRRIINLLASKLPAVSVFFGCVKCGQRWPTS